MLPKRCWGIFFFCYALLTANPQANEGQLSTVECVFVDVLSENELSFFMPAKSPRISSRSRSKRVSRLQSLLVLGLELRDELVELGHHLAVDVEHLCCRISTGTDSRDRRQR